ncbi:MAG: hypothetical protein GXY07_16985 [Candidatus Hydrogenedentes bacterium]|nr:hypothetical protein [Candidatus Hydrogenedentota bacterium]
MPRVYALHEFDLALLQYRAPYRNYSPSMARWTTLDPAGMVDGPNMYAYVKGNPIYSSDILGLITECECEDNLQKCKWNAMGTFFAYMNGLGPVGVAGLILTAGAGYVCYRTGNPYACAAVIGMGFVDFIAIFTAKKYYDRDVAVCKNMHQDCLKHAKKE